MRPCNFSAALSYCKNNYNLILTWSVGGTDLLSVVNDLFFISVVKLAVKIQKVRCRVDSVAYRVVSWALASLGRTIQIKMWAVLFVSDGFTFTLNDRLFLNSSTGLVVNNEKLQQHWHVRGRDNSGKFCFNRSPDWDEAS